MAAWEKDIVLTSECSIAENIGIEKIDLCSTGDSQLWFLDNRSVAKGSGTDY